MLYNQCAHPRCREQIEKPERYCEQHKRNTTQSQYNKDRRKHNKEYVQFYNSSEWKRIRKKALRRDDWLCQRCSKQGLIKSAEIVHHLVETKDNWDLRLELSNLESLCFECHEKVHNNRH